MSDWQKTQLTKVKDKLEVVRKHKIHQKETKYMSLLTYKWLLQINKKMRFSGNFGSKPHLSSSHKIWSTSEINDYVPWPGILGSAG